MKPADRADRVVIFVVDNEHARTNLDACTRAVARYGYQVEAVIVGGPTRGWADACDLVEAGKADRILVANRSQMQGPIVEVATWAHRGGDRWARGDGARRRIDDRTV